jgi:hypothetical protein
MNSGVLQFSLGLATGGFLSPLGAVTNQLKGFIGGLVGLGAITAGVMSAIERGAALEHLSKRTNTSVEDLYKLEEGFKAVGLEADSVGGIIFKLQKSLGGVNEFGVDTRSVFHRMGLEIEQLKKMNAPQQLAAIAARLSRLNTTGAASAAGQIFGREGAQAMIQLANSTPEFAAAMKNAAEDARLFGRNAEAFSHLQQNIKEIKSRVAGMFAGIAEGLAPGIVAIEEQLKNIDFTGFGQRIGKVFTALFEAFREGKATELIALSLQTGFEVGFAIMPALLEKLGYMMIKMFETPLLYLQAGMEYAIESAAHKFATNKYLKLFLMATAPGAAQALAAIGDTGKPDWQQTLKDRKSSGLEFNVGTGAFGLEDINQDANQRLADAMAKIKDISKPLFAMINGLVSRAPKGYGIDYSDKKDDSLEAAQNHYKREATSLEKMGFVMGGMANPLKRSEDLLSQIAGGINKLVAKATLADVPGFGFLNTI